MSANAPEWMKGARPRSKAKQRAYERWPARARELIDEVIEYMKAGGDRYTTVAVADRVNATLKAEGIEGSINANQIAPYCKIEHRVFWSDLGTRR